MCYHEGMVREAKFTPECEEAIAGIRAAFRPGTVMVFDRTREWNGALVKTRGEQWAVTETGAIHALTGALRD